MEFIQCADGSHLVKSRIVAVRINTRDFDSESYVVVAEIDTQRRHHLRELFNGDKAACEAYRDDLIGVKSEPESEAPPKNRKTNRRTTKASSEENADEA